MTALLRPPTGDCLEQAQHFVASPDDLLESPLSPSVRSSYGAVMTTLPHVAKQVLRGTAGVWLARDIPGAAARYIPCNGPGDRFGLILIDIGAYPTNAPLRDVDVPSQYWQLLSPDGVATATRQGGADSSEKAIRYVLLHELGHALSLQAGEFDLDARRQFEPRAYGFLSFSWRARGQADPLSSYIQSDGHGHGTGYVPSRLALLDWRTVRSALHAQPTLLAPGYRRSPNAGEPLCETADKLPRAGFVTPAAALAPTEDYAEIFAHAVLAHEGRIHASDTYDIRFNGCRQSFASPYFSPGVRAKRAYLERVLGFAN